ncbi:carbon monoxide dehydrogenase subunit G [Roseibium sp. TrichSKD4]|uniref:SRPBCC family protein n=1 Tax=Roseibium sp. TrichSKD4 TaxID=744980 RepID=UPI0001E56130|nr:carbon monoxide dehydrogenase subunit G [Roseibium sp. TrichSKD4]EFO33690.1 carbon monoxide dehydrogenase subunit G [Roseibium sp. TrichSKD4]
MDMEGTYRIPAPREKVWDALNDPEVLKACIPGCESLEMTSPTEMTAAVTSKIGPVKAKFKGAVTLENINAPESYTIVGEGKGGVAGFAKGSADVSLAEEGAETVLTYTAKAQVGGKLAQLGSRLIDSTAKKMADEFFGKFSETVGGASAGEDLDAGVAEEAKRIAIEDAPEAAASALQSAEHAAEEAVHKVEEQVEQAAERGALGGPMVWGLIALGAIIVILAVMS